MTGDSLSPKRKLIQSLELAVSDDGATVKVALADDDCLVVDYEIVEAPPVRIRAPLPIKEKLLASARYWAQSDKRIGTASKWLERYVNSREKEIYDQIQEVRRCMKRMRQSVRAIRSAKELIAEQRHEKR